MKFKINPKNCPPKNGGGNAKLVINASLVLSVLCGVPSCTDEIENEIVENNAKMQEFDASDIRKEDSKSLFIKSGSAGLQ